MIETMKHTAVLLCALAPVALAAAEPRLAIDLNAYSRIEIERPPSAVWPHILEPNAWKPDRQLRHHSGPVGAVGEVYAIVTPQDPARIWFLAEDVERVPATRRTLKLLGQDGALLGFAVWRLAESRGRTILEYEVHAEARVAPEQAKTMTPEALAEQRRYGYEVNKKRIDEELAGLKRLVESK